MSDGDKPYRRALRELADSVAGEPPLSGAEVRALAERHRRRRVFGVPAVALSSLLVGGTAFAMGGAFHAAPRPTMPSAATTSAPATPHTSTSDTATAPESAGSSSDGAPSKAAGSGTGPTWPTVGAPSAPSGSGATVSCAVARAGETLASLHTLTIPDGFTSSGIATSGVGIVVFAVPMSCVHGHLVPSGTGQSIPVSPAAVVTTAAPLSAGFASSPSTLQKLASELPRHPGQLFGVHRDSTGQVVRLDQVYQR